MKSEGFVHEQPLTVEYLQHIEALTEEIKAGMDAIAANALGSFEASVSKQQELCWALSRLSEELEGDGSAMKRGVVQFRQSALSERAVAERIRTAAESLQALNLRYAALLNHSGESLRLFVGLCRSYTGSFHETAGMNANRSPWSIQL